MFYYRLANIKDAREIAVLHAKCATKQPDSFMDNLGLRFLKTYYRILLGEKFAFVLLAYKEDNLVGFHSGSLNALEHKEAFKKNKFTLFFSMLGSLIMKPSLILESYKRYKHSQYDPQISYFNGPRGEYWAWDNDCKKHNGALDLHKAWHLTLQNLGYKVVRSEINSNNSRVLRAAKMMGAEVINETADSSNNVRFILEYNLENYKKFHEK